MMNKEEEVRSIGCHVRIASRGSNSQRAASRTVLAPNARCLQSALLAEAPHPPCPFAPCLPHPPSLSSSLPRQRKKGFKKSIDIDEGRRRREETTLQIRKTKKDVRLAKRRQMPVGAAAPAADTPAALAAASMLAAGGAAPGGYGAC